MESIARHRSLEESRLGNDSRIINAYFQIGWAEVWFFGLLGLSILVVTGALLAPDRLICGLMGALGSVLGWIAISIRSCGKPEQSVWEKLIFTVTRSMFLVMAIAVTMATFAA
jgi:cadmium resistance protein CadD (predicted permease)